MLEALVRMNFYALTLFPELFSSFSEVGLVGRAIKDGLLTLQTKQLRDFAINSQGQVDDAPYGGGSGMLLRPDVVSEAVEFAKARLKKESGGKPPVRLSFSPSGKPLTQKLARELVSKHEDFILLCSRYEGVDQRAIDEEVDLEISLGDFVCQGGELPAQIFIETLSRLKPGVLGNPDSLSTESFETGLLEGAQYTRPEVYKDKPVPEVLLSGHHQNIGAWRHEAAKAKTLKNRPELLFRTQACSTNISIALLHHPVLNKQGETITSSITNIDVHDIARSSQTYGLDNFYVVHPGKTLRRLVAKICEHWESGFGATYNENRKEALSLVKVFSALGDVIIDIEQRSGVKPLVVSTSAQAGENCLTYPKARQVFAGESRPILLLLGTGWGLAPEVHALCEHQLAPVDGWSEYNHLSVRAAAAIMLDRLLGKPT